MNSEHINPFLESSLLVLEQMCSIRPSIGSPTVKPIRYEHDAVLLKISVVGDLEGDIIYRFPNSVALKLVSDMMGGMTVTELDELGQSAIAELGNMISGNASTILYSKGITIDITPPKMLHSEQNPPTGKAILVPLSMAGVGDVELYALFRSKQAS